MTEPGQQARYSRAVRERIRGSRFPAHPKRIASPRRPVLPAPPREPASRFQPIGLIPRTLPDICAALGRATRGRHVVTEDARVSVEQCLRRLSPDQLHELWETRHTNAHGQHVSYIPRRHLRLRGVGTLYDTAALTGPMKAEPYAARLRVVEEVCFDLGIRPRTYDGLGPLAAAWLAKHELPRYNWQADLGMEDRFARAYYGGRVEAVRYGRYEGTVYHYDLSSAYPWAMTRTPRMGPRWERCEPADGLLYKLHWKANPAPFYPLPFRQGDGTLCFPREGTGYVWAPEYRQCIGTATDVLEAWRPVAEPYGNPFPLHQPMLALWRMRRHYEDRAAYDSAYADHAGLVKGIMQACFGKLMQQWGGLPGRTYNLAWAGYATSLVRAEVYALAMNNPSGVLAFQTDAILSTRPLFPPDLGMGLGAWRIMEHHGKHRLAPTAGQYRLGDGTEGHMGLHNAITDEEWSELERTDRFSITRSVETVLSLGYAVTQCDASPHTCTERLGRVAQLGETIPARATGRRYTTHRVNGLWQTEAAIVRGESAPYQSRWLYGGQERDYTDALLFDDLSDGGMQS